MDDNSIEKIVSSVYNATPYDRARKVEINAKGQSPNALILRWLEFFSMIGGDTENPPRVEGRDNWLIADFRLWTVRLEIKMESTILKEFLGIPGLPDEILQKIVGMHGPPRDHVILTCYSNHEIADMQDPHTSLLDSSRMQGLLGSTTPHRDQDGDVILTCYSNHETETESLLSFAWRLLQVVFLSSMMCFFRLLGVSFM